MLVRITGLLADLDEEAVVVEREGLAYEVLVPRFALGGRAAAAAVESAMSQPQRDALELLVAWGDSRADAQRWIERAGQLHPELSEVEAWVKAAYRIKTGAEA